MSSVQVILALLGVYLGAGLFFAAVFALSGVERIDHSAKGCTPGFRFMILPGAAALWPLLLARWLRGTDPPAADDPKAGGIERTRGVAGSFWAVVGPLLLAWFILAVRSGGRP